jgi:uncharacterized delta-60 repeat protein
MRTRIALGAVGAALVTAIGMAAPALAQTSGSVDTVFGSDGLVNLPSGVGSVGQILVQSNGLIDVISSETDPTTGNSDMAVVQYQANGTLNATFGNDGVALASFPGFAVVGLSGSAESGGNIVVAGQGNPVATVTASGTTGGGPDEETVAEFNSSGTLDASFGTGGEVITQDPSPIGEGVDSGGPVIVQPNGDIVTGGGVGGTGCNPRKNCSEDDVLTRYLPNGSLDTNFGDGGFSEVDVSSFATEGLGEDASGNIYALEANSLSGPTAVEFSPSGAEESATTSTPPTLIAFNDLLADGTYVLGKNVSAGGNAEDQQAVLHELPSGEVDPNFNSPAFDYANDSGSAEDSINASVLAPNGDVVVAGIHCTAIDTRRGCESANGEIGIAALTPTGSLDTTFGNGGVTTLPEESGGVAALAVAANGDYLVAFGTTIAAVLS